MGKMISVLVPEFCKQWVRLWRSRHLISEINKLEVESFGICEEGYPWVILKGGVRFNGFLPTPAMSKLYSLLSTWIPEVEEKYFTVMFDIVNRYVMPRNMPGESYFNPSRYRPIRDALNDYRLSKDEWRHYAEYFRPKLGDVFVDLGAYIGYGLMRVSSEIGDSGKLIAFESDPDVLKVLRKNIQDNNIKNVVLIDKAVGCKSGEMTFFRKTGTVNSLNSWVLNNLGYEDLKEVTVQVESLDNVLNELKIDQVDMVNITVNGGEVDALKGMSGLLQRSKALRITLAGWYYLPSGEKVCDVAGPYLEAAGLKVMIGRLGRVLAWK